MPRASRTTDKPFRLGLLLFPDCMPAGLFAAADLVRACNQRAGAERVSLVWAGADRTIPCAQDRPALATSLALADGQCDAWLLPGLWMRSAEELAAICAQQAPLIQAIRALPRRTSLWTYCAGVALTAAAGRLDGLSATATWWLQAAVAARFPRVDWRAGQSLCVDRGIATAPGASGHLPLMLDRLAALYPADVLHDVQEALMLPLPRDRHPAFLPVEMMTLRDPVLRHLLIFIQGTPAQEVDLRIAAEHARMSVRTMCRRVKAATGLAAGDWLRRIKLHQAGEALRGSRQPVKSICDQLGFGNEASLHRAFKAVTGATPTTYRQLRACPSRSDGMGGDC
jgi:transcriptional regulator GlxA family with amidase domain